MLFAAVTLVAAIGAHGLKCKDEYGVDVDWYYLYKLPRNRFSSNPLVREGLAYLYLSSRNINYEWTLARYDITDENSVLGKTLAPLYDPDGSSSIFHAMYNDYPPGIKHEERIGVTKGVIFGDANGSVWLVHSIPEFPPPVAGVPSATNSTLGAGVTDKYHFPVSQLPYGHLSLCLSLSRVKKTERKIKKHLKPMEPRVYSSRMFDTDLGDLDREYVPGLYRSQVSATDGKLFSLYGAKRFAYADIYESVALSNGHASLYVEASANGQHGASPPICEAEYGIRSILVLGLPVGSYPNTIFVADFDRSKWAVSKNPALVCVGDLERSLVHRGKTGGVICTTDANVWKAFADAVLLSQLC